MSCLASHRAAAWINVGLAVILVLHASPTEAGSPAPERHVYMLRGAGGIRYWPRGDLLIRRLQAAGFSVDDFSSSEVLRMAELVRCRHRTGQQQGPLVFLGYSSGGDSACRVAKRLQRDGIEVGHL
ncbi:MAG TPA: thioesterase domain-containing protein, partial [Pirellulaceae bacterium]